MNRKLAFSAALSLVVSCLGCGESPDDNEADLGDTDVNGDNHSDSVGPSAGPSVVALCGEVCDLQLPFHEADTGALADEMNAELRRDCMSRCGDTLQNGAFVSKRVCDTDGDPNCWSFYTLAVDRHLEGPILEAYARCLLDNRLLNYYALGVIAPGSAFDFERCDALDDCLAALGIDSRAEREWTGPTDYENEIAGTSCDQSYYCEGCNVLGKEDLIQ